MSAVIIWTCALCGKRAEDLSFEEFLTLDNAHVCRVADVIRLAVHHFRGQSTTGDRIAEWLEACASQAEPMEDPTDFAVCDEPDSVQRALAVARTVPWEDS